MTKRTNFEISVSVRVLMVYDPFILNLDEYRNPTALGSNINWENMWRDIFGIDPRKSYRGFYGEM